MSDTDPLFEELVAASGLSPVFARGALARALQRGGIDPSRLSRRDLARALPMLERALAVFLKPEELRVRMWEISRLAASSGNVDAV